MNLDTSTPMNRLQGALLELEGNGAGVPIETWHTFAAGLVARTIFIPAGTVLVGAIHKAECLCICQGDITVRTADGEPRRLTGYHVLPSSHGAKRAGWAHADTWWTTVSLNPDELRDPDAIEEALVQDADTLQRRRLLALKATPLEALV